MTELLVRRVDEAITKAKELGEGGPSAGADNLNQACNLALCLAQWDSAGAQRALRALTDLCFRNLAPAQQNSLCSRMYLSGQLPALIIARARTGDHSAIAEYALWVKSVDPKDFSWQPRELLSPLMRFPDDPAFQSVFRRFFMERSKWFEFFQEIVSPDPKGVSSPWFALEEFFSTPVINNRSFKFYVSRLLHNKTPGGRIAGGYRGEYWLEEKLSNGRRFGYVIKPEEEVGDLAGLSFRTCDFYAWVLSNRIEGAPKFQLYWPEPQRDAAISGLEKLLSRKGLKNRPFQERLAQPEFSR